MDRRIGAGEGGFAVTADLRIGVIGLGFGANHARILEEMPGVRLAAVADTNAESLLPFEGTSTHVHSGYAWMLASEDLDAVVVAVPAALHLDASLRAIKAGCAVLVEKPLAPSLQDATRIVDAARQAGCCLMPGHIERFNPAVVEAACRVRRGEIGRVLHVAARRMSATRAGAHGNRLPPTDVNVVHDSAIHDIDAMRFIVGLEVESVFAASQSGVVRPVEDSVSAVLRFAGADSAQPGPIAGLNVSWLSQHRLRDVTIMGEQGSLFVDYAAQTLALSRSTDTPATQLPVQPADQLRAELMAFVAAVRDGAPLAVTPEDGLAAVAVADAITRSARTGSPMDVEAFRT